MSGWLKIPPSEWVDTPQEVAEMGQYLLNSGPSRGIAFDTETTGLRTDRDIPLMLSFSDGLRRFACMADKIHDPWIKDAVLGNEQISIIGTNLKFDMHMAANVGVHLKGPLEDTLVQSWLHNENRFGHGLKDTARDYCGLKMLDFRDIFPMRRATKAVPGETAGDAINRVMADPEGRLRAIEYAGLDAYASHGVREHLREQLMEESIGPSWSLWDHFTSWESPFTRVLWNCERRGFTICTGHLKSQMGPMERAMEALEAELARKAGRVLNPQSPKQLQKFFFDELKYKPIKYTKGGASGKKQPSTDEEVLSQFAEQGCEYSKIIIEHRKIQKIYGTYITGLLQWVDSDLRAHTTLKQQGTVTGRLSSSEPNLQNIPRPAGDVFRIREGFVAAPGKKLVIADYDQLEMKLMAHFSQDQRMVDAINGGMDLHCYTVSLMFGVPYDEVFAAKKAKNPTPEQEMLKAMRQVAKAIGFGLIYGIGPMKLALQLTEELKREVTKDEAMMNIRKYFDVFSGVQEFIKQTHVSCQKSEFVQTLLGRKRRLPQINAKGGSNADPDGRGIAAEAKRQSVNSIIQGTAADVAKAAMIRAENDPELQRLGAELLMQIHDELIFEVDDIPEVIEAVEKRVQAIMEKPFGDDFSLLISLTTEAHNGYSWSEAK